MLVFSAFILFVLILSTLTNKKKPKYRPKSVTKGSKSDLAPVRNKSVTPGVNQAALELATKHFGWEWIEFLASKNLKVNVSIEKIRREIAIGYSKMGQKPLEHLLMSFLQVTSNSSGLTIGVQVNSNNYGALHQSVYDLIRANRFNSNAIQTTLGVLAESARIQRGNIYQEQTAKMTELNAKQAHEKENLAVLRSRLAAQREVQQEKKWELKDRAVKYRTENEAAAPERQDPVQPAVVPPTITATIQIKPVENKEDDSVIEVSSYSERISLPALETSSTVKSTQLERNAYPEYDPDMFALGKKYKTKLNLSAQEAKWLNKFWNHSNVFNAISGCEIEIVRLFLSSVKKLNKKLKAEGTTLDQEIAPLKKMTSDFEKSQADYWYGYDEIHAGDSAETEAYCFIYKMAEMVIREQWNHKRKISASFYSRSAEVKEKFDQRLGAMIQEMVISLIPTIGQPDEETEIALNEATTTRWKIYFEKITGQASTVDHAETFAALYRLGELNSRNPSVEQVYYEASKFAASIDKTEALKFYLHYVWADLNSTVIDNKQLNKTIQKKLFSTEDQLNIFQTIINNLVDSRNFPLALMEVENVYRAKRKTIKLSSEAIQRVQDQHSGTVDKLNEYLQDEEELLQITVPKQVTQETAVTTAVPTAEISPTGIALETFQKECLQLFTENNFSVGFAAIEIFAKSKAMFKNQLIDGINERCYELVDDMLIEETEDGYEINPDYYQKILA